MRKLTRRGLLAAIALALPALALLMAALALDGQPRLPAGRASTPEELAQVHRLLRIHDPRRSRPGSNYVVALSSAELSLLVGHVARSVGGAATVQLGPGSVRLVASLPAPRLPGAWWFNVEATLHEGQGLPVMAQLKVGPLPLPAPLARWLGGRAIAWLDGDSGGDGEPLHRLVQGVSLQPQFVQLRYRWRADAPARLAARWLDDAQRERLQAYADALATASAGETGPLGLPDLFAPLFRLAAARSVDDASAVAENRAVLQVLALYANGKPLSSLLPAARHRTQTRPRPLWLAGREDFAQHFIVSALLAAEAGGAVADALSLGKELDDSRHGSGFSFSDIAVNRAGRRFGEFALREARRLQLRLAGGVEAAALMPEVADLAEFMSERSFVDRFGGVGAPAYRRMLAEIDARVAALALYH